MSDNHYLSEDRIYIAAKAIAEARNDYEYERTGNIRPDFYWDAKAAVAAVDRKDIKIDKDEVIYYLYEACREFVDKVERGEARSKRSYEQMKNALLIADEKLGIGL